MAELTDIGAKLYARREAFIKDLFFSRGFFVTSLIPEIRLDSSAHEDDAFFLERLIKKSRINMRTLITATDANVFCSYEKKLKDVLFSAYPEQNKGRDMTSEEAAALVFKNMNKGFKVECEIIDPYIASLVKCLNLAGVLTRQSCDGHRGGNIFPMISVFETASLERMKNIITVAATALTIKVNHIIFENRMNFFPVKGDWKGLYHSLHQLAAYIYGHRSEFPYHLKNLSEPYILKNIPIINK